MGRRTGAFWHSSSNRGSVSKSIVSSTLVMFVMPVSGFWGPATLRRDSDVLGPVTLRYDGLLGDVTDCVGLLASRSLP